MIHRPPQIMQRASDTDEHFVEMPSVSWLRPSSAQPPGEVRTELQAPVPDALMGHHDAAFGKVCVACSARLAAAPAIHMSETLGDQKLLFAGLASLLFPSGPERMMPAGLAYIAELSVAPCVAPIPRTRLIATTP
jgi:hypothetical protein